MSENSSAPVVEPMKVFIRVRPDPEGSTASQTGPGCLSIVDETTLQISGSGKYAKDKVYTFTEVFRESTTQDLMYAKVEPLVNDAVQGYNTAVFAYGAIASGKTYTIIGNKNEQGIMPRAIRDLFQLTDKIQAENPNVFYFIEATYVEIYNNKFRNLLKADDTDRIDIHESANLGVFLTGNSLRVPVTSAEQAITLISGANSLRVTRSRNKVSSSRGHGVLTFFIERRHITEGKTKLSVGSLNIVDLAGIEKLTTSSGSGNNPQHGELYIEAQSINSSLNGVGDVLSALAEESTKAARRRKSSVTTAGGAGSDMSAYLDSAGDDTGSVNGSIAATTVSTTLTPKKSMHIPYLNSKLTHYLKEALGGNCRSTMICTLLPGNDSNTSTVLMYAEWAMKIRHSLRVNVINTEDNWTNEKDPEANKLKTNLDVRSKETEEISRKKLIGLNLPPPPTLEQVVVTELAETASELAALRRSSLMRQESHNANKKLSSGGSGEGSEVDPSQGTGSAAAAPPAAAPVVLPEVVFTPPAAPDTRDQEIADLKAKLASTTADLQRERAAKCPKCPEHEATIASLREINRLSTLNMSELNGKVVQLSEDLQKEHQLRMAAEGRAAVLESQLAALRRENEQLLAEGDKAVHKVSDLEQTLAKEERSLAAEAKQLNELQHRLSADEAQLSGASGKIAALEKALSDKEGENEQLRKALKANEAACAACQEKLVQVTQVLTEKDMVIARLSGSIGDKEKALSELEALIEALKRDKEALQGQPKVEAPLLKEAYTAKAVATARADAAEEALSKSKAELAALRGQLEGAKQQWEEAAMRLETVNTSRDELEKQNSELTLQVTQLRTQLSEAESTDEEVDTETVEVEQTITETEVVGEDGEIEIRREIVETTRTTKVHDLHHHSSKVNLMVESTSASALEN